ncbi:MAG: methyltransferase domain-containing protein [Chlamydiales bacterium]|nr:methyltransferase domain-containing protein [Chlamydiales bacterium]
MVLAKIKYWLYRLSTIFRSFKTLYTLSPEKVDAFVNSYNIYHYDWKNEKELIEHFGVDYYNQVKKCLVDYYSVLNHLCAIGQVEKMYIPAAMDLSKSLSANQKLFEKKMSLDLGVQEGQRVLDIGCGRGRIASHVATLTNTEVTGMNIDNDQLESARQFILGNGLSKQCQFKLADLNDLPLPFPDHSFDAVYEVGVFTYSKDLKKLFKEIHRILKPGGKFAALDWILLPNYNPNNPHHVDLMKRIKPLVGAIGNPSPEEFAGALKEAGFEVLTNENASIDGLQAPLIENADQFFCRVKKIMEYLVRYKILPAHFKTLFDRLTQDGEAFVEADRLRLVTSSHYFLAKKSSLETS